MTRVAKSLLTNKDKQRATLDPKQRSKITEDIRKKLYNEIIGQDNAIDTIVDSMSRLITGIRNLEKPILNLLFLGPTGTGKTETVKVLADSFFGSRVAFTRINCQELSAEHTVAKLLGSPPGYIGGDVQPLLSEENIIRHCEEAWVKEKGVYTETNEISRKYDPSQNEFLSIGSVGPPPSNLDLKVCNSWYIWAKVRTLACINPLTTSWQVPSPPMAMTISYPCSPACFASSVA